MPRGHGSSGNKPGFGKKLATREEMRDQVDECTPKIPSSDPLIVSEIIYLDSLWVPKGIFRAPGSCRNFCCFLSV
jgi:hypothetical protein